MKWSSAALVARKGLLMQRKLTTACVLAILAMWSQAQTWAASRKDNTGVGEPVTVQGCLQSSLGQFSIVDKDGMTQQLSFSKKLLHYVGHEIEVTGVTSIRTYDTTQAGAASSAVEQRVVDVKSVKEISKTCSPGSN